MACAVLGCPQIHSHPFGMYWNPDYVAGPSGPQDGEEPDIRPPPSVACSRMPPGSVPWKPAAGKPTLRGPPATTRHMSAAKIARKSTKLARNRPKWIKIEQKGSLWSPKSSKMVQNVQNVPKSSKNAQNQPKWIKIVQNRPK